MPRLPQPRSPPCVPRHRRAVFELAGEASSAKDALEPVRRRRPRVLLVDYRLPYCSGAELVRELRRRGESAAVVVMTAIPEPGLFETVNKAGGQGSVLKTA